MANMSYCRFENTSRDMQDCIEAIEEAGGIKEYIEIQEPSEYELAGIKRFVELCNEFSNNYNKSDCNID